MKQKVWLVDQPGGSFREVYLDRPPLAKNQVLVNICASGVNPLDTKIRAGKASHAKHPLPAVLRLDMAGVVEEVGRDVEEFRPGDAVYGVVGGVGGLQGTLAEFVAPDVDLLAHKRKNLSMREAAVLPLCIITASEGLVDRAHVRADQTVLTPCRRWRRRSYRRSDCSCVRSASLRHRLPGEEEHRRILRCSSYRLPVDDDRRIRQGAHWG